MFGIPWSYIGIFLALVGVVATGYFAVQHYNAVVKENVELRDKNKTLQAQKDQLNHDYQNIVSTVDKNANMEQKVVEKTNTVVKEIRSAPVTTACVQTPSIGIALKSLKEPQQ